MIYYQVGVGPWAAMVPLFLALLVLFTLGVTLITSAINVFYRDVNPVVQIGLQLWLYLTPVAYPLSAVPGTIPRLLDGEPARRRRGRPARRRWCSAVNRTGPVVGISSALIAVIFVIGVVVFKNTDKYFADVI